MRHADTIRDRLGDRYYRLTSGLLYRIKDRHGRIIPFMPNAVQRNWLARMHTRNIILKARQLGFTTVAAICLLDDMIFSRHHTGGIVAQDLESAESIFLNIVRFAFEHLPPWIRSSVRTRTDRRGEIVLDSGSRILVDSSFRSGTLQWLHVSEYGRLCASAPERAREVQTGALNTISPSGTVVIESTAEGSSGDFVIKVQRAQALVLSGTRLSPLDYRLFFYPWWVEPSYAIDDDTPLLVETKDYFGRLRDDPYIMRICPGKTFTRPQQLWYQKKYEEQDDDMYREFPSTPDEAFRVRRDGEYYHREMARARRDDRIGDYPYDPSLPVCTAWDLGGAGGGDDTVVWFWQVVGSEVRIIDYFEGSGYSLVDVVRDVIMQRPYEYETHHLPHDVEVHEYTTGRTRLQTARELLGRGVRVVPRRSIADGIEAVRSILSRCYFHGAACHRGIEHIESYTREYDDRAGIWLDRPRHDRHSHAADALRYLALSLREDGEKRKNESFEVEGMEW